MKIRWITILLIIVMLGAGAALLVRHAREPQGLLETPRPPVPEAAVKPPVDTSTRSEQPSFREPAPKPNTVPQIETITEAETPTNQPPAKKPPPRRTTLEEEQNAALKRYWTTKQKLFDQLWAQLEQEQDPDKRRRLIQQMSYHVRVDTLAALDWATGLTDEEERRIAMDAISKNALVGIGARLQLDATGFPSIQETTELSSIDGQVEPGDYIIGMHNENGEAVYFEGMPLPEIVQHLRGEAGTRIRLLMQRMPESGNSDPSTFEIPITRSMIILQPRFYSDGSP